MKQSIRPEMIILGILGILLPTALLGTPAETSTAALDMPLDMPWRQAGLSERQAAAHLLDRFAYGARPRDIDRLVAMGLDSWFLQQLAGPPEGREVTVRLKDLRSLELSSRDMAKTYPAPGRVRREAIRAGVVDAPDPDGMADDSGTAGDTSASRQGVSPQDRRKILAWAQKQGYRAMREAVGEAMVQKLYRAVYSEAQLHEMLTDFWFNHFNVSITDNRARPYVWTYERDAIRPHVVGDFRDMLEATAKHPAMLHYLDNVTSVADSAAPKRFDRQQMTQQRNRAGQRARRGGGGNVGSGNVGSGNRGNGRFDRQRQAENRQPGNTARQRSRSTARQRNRPAGLNENYARELLELHTLGVDGGYSQEDVVAVARAFTGWATFPPEGLGRDMERRVRRAQRFPRAGFVFEDSFLFRADQHDAAAKTVLGHELAAGGGIEDGLQVLDLVATHPATARHLATKLARKFVADEPPPLLIERLTERFLEGQGDLRQVMVALVESPEFWSPETRGQKIKSPFELVVSSLRATGADVFEPRQTVEWIARIGQPLYAYQAPTGYPDRADSWVNTGALLNRMNFGLQLATGRIAGVRLDLPALNQHREPESLDDALETYVPLLLPERDANATVSRLQGVVRDPELASKIAKAAPEGASAATAGMDREFDDWDMTLGAQGPRGRRARRPPPPIEIDSSPLAHVVGVILGSPEFQRR